jgi:integrase
MQVEIGGREMPVYKIEGAKRDGLQKYRVVVNYTAGGKKRSVERLVYGKAQAENAEAAIRAELAKKAPVAERKDADRDLTVKGLLELYEKEHGPEIRKTTLDKKKSILENHAMGALGKVKLRDLIPALLLEWRTALNAEPLKATTKNSAFRELRAILNFAVSRGLLAESPMKGLKPFRDPYKETAAAKIRYYTKEEFTAFLEAAKDAAKKRGDLRTWGIYMFFMLAVYTGARKGEINALRWTDIEKDRIHIRRSVTQKVKGEAWVETPPKTQTSVRTVQMPGQLRDALAAHRKRQEGADGWNERYFVCGGENPIPDTTLENANIAYGKAAGVKHITIHEFRHTHASLLCNAGINVKEVARRLGHADAEITLKTYAHLYPQEEERAVAVFDGL